MSVRLFYAALLQILFFSISTNAFGINFWKFRNMVEEHRRQESYSRLKQHSFMKPSVFGPRYTDQYLTQSLDHFDAKDKTTYKQRYWVNKDFWRNPDGPVFLYIGGEGALSSLTVQTGEHVDLAKKYGALVFAVEHRYYGESINDDGLKLENMQFLSSQQALADLASFHMFVSKNFGLTERNTWICFGGSYPGSLSAWFRLKYPHLVYGAIASSAPVRAKVDFQGYNNVVAASLSDPIVNGSIKCALNVKHAFSTIDSMLSGGELKKLEEDFRSCGHLTDWKDTYQFVSNLADVFMGTVQYNLEIPTMDIAELCTDMTKSEDPYENLKQLNMRFLEESKQNCSDNSWANMIKMLSNTTVDRGVTGASIRQWLYQTCTQFGYYQTCETSTTCVFSKHMSLRPNLRICNELFQIMTPEIYERVQFTNAYYGSDHPKGTRIVFVNGSIDPWHALSVLRNQSATETAIYIPGTAHCANMESDQPSDPPALRKARQEIDFQIGQWLKEAAKTNTDNTLYYRNL